MYGQHQLFWSFVSLVSNTWCLQRHRSWVCELLVLWEADLFPHSHNNWMMWLFAVWKFGKIDINLKTVSSVNQFQDERGECKNKQFYVKTHNIIRIITEEPWKTCATNNARVWEKGRWFIDPWFPMPGDELTQCFLKVCLFNALAVLNKISA